MDRIAQKAVGRTGASTSLRGSGLGSQHRIGSASLTERERGGEKDGSGRGKSAIVPKVIGGTAGRSGIDRRVRLLVIRSDEDTWRISGRTQPPDLGSLRRIALMSALLGAIRCQALPLSDNGLRNRARR